VNLNRAYETRTRINKDQAASRRKPTSPGLMRRVPGGIMDQLRSATQRDLDESDVIADAERMDRAQGTTVDDTVMDRLRKPAAFKPKSVPATSKQTGYVMVLLRLLDNHNATVSGPAREWWMKFATVDATGRVIGTSLDAVQVSEVITRLKGHLSGPAVVADVPVAVVADAPKKFDAYDDITDGNYAIERDGKTHFYRVTRRAGKGQYAGRTFINIQERASDVLHPVRGNWTDRSAILNEIRAAGVDESHLMYADRLGRCWHCHASLTDDTGNPYRHLGLGPICGGK
jgi:hypothetical protein